MRQFGLFLSYHIGLPLSVMVVLMVGVLMIYYSMLSRKNPAGSELTADDNGLRTEALDGSQQHYYSWDQTQTVIESKNLYIVVFKNQIAIFFNKQILAGRDAEFEVILQRNVNPKLIKRRV